jgi:hypothetical protein
VNLDVTEPTGPPVTGLSVRLLPGFPDDDRWQVLLFNPNRPATFNSMRTAPAYGKGALQKLNGKAQAMHNEIGGWRQFAHDAAALAARSNALADVVPHLHGPYTVDVYHRRITDAGAPDVGSTFVAAKAALDGLVDAGLLAGDGPKLQQRLTFWPYRRAGYDGLLLVVTTVPDQGTLPI